MRTASTELPEIVRRAMVETVTDIGQLSKSELYQLNKYVKRGWLSRGKGGPYPILKTVYAYPAFDFAASRERYVEHAMMLAKLDREMRRSCCACGSDHVPKRHRAATEQREDGE